MSPGVDSPRDRAAEVNERHRPVHISADTVTRPSHRASPTVHAFLRHLRGQGLDCVPEPLSLDQHTETLRFIEGDSGGLGWRHQHHEQGLRSAARLLRLIHDASKSWEPPPDAVFGTPAVDVPPDDTRVYCHGDPGPWDFVWRDGEAVALLDWDFLHPAPPLDDVAYALVWFAPLRDDEACLDWHHFPHVPDRRARIAAFLTAYGPLPPFDVADAAITRRHGTIAQLRALADQGVEPQRTWVADGLVEDEEAEIRWIQAHREELTSPGSSGGSAPSAP